MTYKSPKKFGVKATALIIAALFIWETAAWATPAALHDVLSKSYKVQRDGIQIPDQAQIPSSLGIVTEVFHAVRSTNDALLVHIEDAHGEAEAQKNTQAILEHLQKEYGIKTFFLEGAWSKLEPALLQFSKDPAQNEKILEELTEKGIVGGPENFLFGNSRDNAQRTAYSDEVEGYGIEDLELYKKNLAQFRAVMSAKAESEAFLDEMKSGLLTKASQVLNPELASYFRQWSFQEEVQTDYSAHLRSLAEFAQKHLALDLNDAREQYDWPMLVRFQKLKLLESYSVQSTAHSEEKKRFQGWLQNKNLISTKQIDLILSDEVRGTVYDVRSFFESFYEKAAPLGFKFKDYPALSKEWGKQILSQELDAPTLIKEIETLENKLIKKLSQTPDEKKLVEKYREYLLLRKLLHLELSKIEWQQFKTTDHRLLTTDLRKGAVPSEARGLTPMVSQIVEQANNFYTTAEARDQAMVERTLDWIKKEKIEKAAIITGGFHSEGMGELLKQKNISYLRIQPRITQIHGRENYLKLMTELSDLRFMSSIEPHPFEPQTWRDELNFNANRNVANVSGEGLSDKGRSEMRSAVLVESALKAGDLEFKLSEDPQADLQAVYQASLSQRREDDAYRQLRKKRSLEDARRLLVDYANKFQGLKQATEPHLLEAELPDKKRQLVWAWLNEYSNDFSKFVAEAVRHDPGFVSEEVKQSVALQVIEAYGWLMRNAHLISPGTPKLTEKDFEPDEDWLMRFKWAADSNEQADLAMEAVAKAFESAMEFRTLETNFFLHTVFALDPKRGRDEALKILKMPVFRENQYVRSVALRLLLEYFKPDEELLALLRYEMLSGHPPLSSEAILGQLFTHAAQPQIEKLIQDFASRDDQFHHAFPVLAYFAFIQPENQWFQKQLAKVRYLASASTSEIAERYKPISGDPTTFKRKMRAIFEIAENTGENWVGWKEGRWQVRKIKSQRVSERVNNLKEAAFESDRLTGHDAVIDLGGWLELFDEQTGRVMGDIKIREPVETEPGFVDLNYSILNFYPTKEFLNLDEVTRGMVPETIMAAALNYRRTVGRTKFPLHFGTTLHFYFFYYGFKNEIGGKSIREFIRPFSFKRSEARTDENKEEAYSRRDNFELIRKGDMARLAQAAEQSNRIKIRLVGVKGRPLFDDLEYLLLDRVRAEELSAAPLKRKWRTAYLENEDTGEIFPTSFSMLESGDWTYRDFSRSEARVFGLSIDDAVHLKVIGLLGPLLILSDFLVAFILRPLLAGTPYYWAPFDWIPDFNTPLGGVLLHVYAVEAWMNHATNKQKGISKFAAWLEKGPVVYFLNKLGTDPEERRRRAILYVSIYVPLLYAVAEFLAPYLPDALPRAYNFGATFDWKDTVANIAALISAFFLNRVGTFRETAQMVADDMKSILSARKITPSQEAETKNGRSEARSTQEAWDSAVRQVFEDRYVFVRKTRLLKAWDLAMSSRMFKERLNKADDVVAIQNAIEARSHQLTAHFHGMLLGSGIAILALEIARRNETVLTFLLSSPSLIVALILSGLIYAGAVIFKMFQLPNQEDDLEFLSEEIQSHAFEIENKTRSNRSESRALLSKEEKQALYLDAYRIAAGHLARMSRVANVHREQLYRWRDELSTEQIKLLPKLQRDGKNLRRAYVIRRGDEEVIALGLGVSLEQVRKDIRSMLQGEPRLKTILKWAKLYDKTIGHRLNKQPQFHSSKLAAKLAKVDQAALYRGLSEFGIIQKRRSEMRISSEDYFGVLRSKAGNRVFFNEGPLLQPELIAVFDADQAVRKAASFKAGANFQDHTAPDWLTEKMSAEDFFRIYVSGAAPAEIVFKPNAGSLGERVTFMSRAASEIKIRLAHTGDEVDKPDSYPSQINDAFRRFGLQGLSHFRYWRNEDLVEFTLPKDHPRVVEILTEVWKILSVQDTMSQSNYDPGMVERRIDFLKVNGKSLETRITFNHDFETDELVLDEEWSSDGYGTFTKVGSSAFFANQAFRPRAYEKLGEEAYDEVLRAVGVVLSQRDTFKAYVRDQLMAAMHFSKKRFLEAGFPADLKVEFSMDFQWLPPEAGAVFPRPVLIESDMRLFTPLSKGASEMVQPFSQRSEMRSDNDAQNEGDAKEAIRYQSLFEALAKDVLHDATGDFGKKVSRTWGELVVDYLRRLARWANNDVDAATMKAFLIALYANGDWKIYPKEKQQVYRLLIMSAKTLDSQNKANAPGLFRRSFLTMLGNAMGWVAFQSPGALAGVDQLAANFVRKLQNDAVAEMSHAIEFWGGKAWFNAEGFKHIGLPTNPSRTDFDLFHRRQEVLQMAKGDIAKFITPMLHRWARAQPNAILDINARAHGITDDVSYAKHGMDGTAGLRFQQRVALDHALSSQNSNDPELIALRDYVAHMSQKVMAMSPEALDRLTNVGKRMKTELGDDKSGEELLSEIKKRDAEVVAQINNLAAEFDAYFRAKYENTRPEINQKLEDEYFERLLALENERVELQGMTRDITAFKNEMAAFNETFRPASVMRSEARVEQESSPVTAKIEVSRSASRSIPHFKNLVGNGKGLGFLPFLRAWEFLYHTFKMWTSLQKKPWPIIIEGAENLWTKEQLILAGNHTGLAENLFFVTELYRLAGRMPFFIAQPEHVDALTQTLIKMGGGLPIEKGKTVAKAEEFLKANPGSILGIFPSGRPERIHEKIKTAAVAQKSTEEIAHDFLHWQESAVAKIAIETGVAVVPFAIDSNVPRKWGAKELWHAFRQWEKTGAGQPPFYIKVRIGKPISPKGKSEEELLSSLKNSVVANLKVLAINPRENPQPLFEDYLRQFSMLLVKQPNLAKWSDHDILDFFHENMPAKLKGFPGWAGNLLRIMTPENEWTNTLSADQTKLLAMYGNYLKFEYGEGSIADHPFTMPRREFVQMLTGLFGAISTAGLEGLPGVVVRKVSGLSQKVLDDLPSLIKSLGAEKSALISLGHSAVFKWATAHLGLDSAFRNWGIKNKGLLAELWDHAGDTIVRRPDGSLGAALPAQEAFRQNVLFNSWLKDILLGKSDQSLPEDLRSKADLVKDIYASAGSLLGLFNRGVDIFSKLSPRAKRGITIYLGKQNKTGGSLNDERYFENEIERIAQRRKSAEEKLWRVWFERNLRFQMAAQHVETVSNPDPALVQYLDTEWRKARVSIDQQLGGELRDLEDQQKSTSVARKIIQQVQPYMLSFQQRTLFTGRSEARNHDQDDGSPSYGDQFSLMQESGNWTSHDFSSRSEIRTWVRAAIQAVGFSLSIWISYQTGLWIFELFLNHVGWMQAFFGWALINAAAIFTFHFVLVPRAEKIEGKVMQKMGFNESNAKKEGVTRRNFMRHFAGAAAGAVIGWRSFKKVSKMDPTESAVYREQMLIEIARKESPFFKAGVGYDPISGLTYDGIDLNAEQDENGDQFKHRDWTAPSKEALHLTFLMKALQGNQQAKILIGLSDEEILDLLERKMNTYEKLAQQYPGWGGFLPWLRVGKNGEVEPLPNWKNWLPPLDNGQWAWALKSISDTLREKAAEDKNGDFEKSATRVDAYLSQLKKNAVTIFHEGQGRVRGEVYVRNPSGAVERGNYASDAGAKAESWRKPYFLEDAFEGKQMLWFMDLFGDWNVSGSSEADKDKMWERTQQGNIARLVKLPDGREIMVQEQHKGWPNEGWHRIFLPYDEIPIVKAVSDNTVKAITHHARYAEIPGLFAPIRDLDEPKYTSDNGYPTVSKFRNGVKTPDAFSPAGLTEFLKSNFKAAAAWLHFVTAENNPWMTNPIWSAYGSVDAWAQRGTERENRKLSRTKTWDGLLYLLTLPGMNMSDDTARWMTPQQRNRFYTTEKMLYEDKFGKVEDLKGRDIEFAPLMDFEAWSNYQKSADLIRDPETGLSSYFIQGESSASLERKSGKLNLEYKLTAPNASAGGVLTMAHRMTRIQQILIQASSSGQALTAHLEFKDWDGMVVQKKTFQIPSGNEPNSKKVQRIILSSEEMPKNIKEIAMVFHREDGIPLQGKVMIEQFKIDNSENVIVPASGTARSEMRMPKAGRDSLPALRFFYSEILRLHLDMMRASYRPVEEDEQKQAVYDAVVADLKELQKLLQGHPRIRRQLASRIRSAVSMLAERGSKRNPVAAGTALTQAVEDILNKLYEPRIKKQGRRHRDSLASKKIVHLKDGTWILKQGVYRNVKVGKRGSVAMTQKQDKEFSSLWELARSLDHQLEKMTSELAQARETLAVLQDIQDFLEYSAGELPPDLSARLGKTLKTMQAQWVIEKQLAVQALQFAVELEHQEVRSRVARFAEYGSWLIKMRADELEGMIASVQRLREKDLKNEVISRNYNFARSLRSLKVTLERYFGTTGVTWRSAREPRPVQAKIAGIIRDLEQVLEPDYDGVLALMRGVQSGFGQSLKASNPEIETRLLRYVEVALGLVKFSDVRHNSLFEFEKRKREIGSKSEEMDEDAIFQTVFQDLINQRKLNDRSQWPSAWFDLYAFAREPIHLTVQKERVPNPRFEALRVLGQILGAKSLQDALNRKKVKSVPGLAAKIKELGGADLSQSVLSLPGESRKQLFEFIQTAFQLENKLPLLPAQYRARSEVRTEIMPQGSKRFFDEQGRWIKTEDRNGNLVDEIVWSDNQIKMIRTRNSDGTFIVLKSDYDGLVHWAKTEGEDAFIGFEPGLNLNSVKSIPYAELTLRSLAPKGSSPAIFRVLSLLMKDQNVGQVKYLGNPNSGDSVPSARLFNSLLETMEPHAEADLQDVIDLGMHSDFGEFNQDKNIGSYTPIRAKFQLDPAAVEWRSSPFERIFFETNKGLASMDIRNGKIQRIFYDRQIYLDTNYLVSSADFSALRKTIKNENGEFKAYYEDEHVLTVEQTGKVLFEREVNGVAKVSLPKNEVRSEVRVNSSQQKLVQPVFNEASQTSHETQIAIAGELTWHILPSVFVNGFSVEGFQRFWITTFFDSVQQNQMERANRAIKGLNSAAKVTDGLVLLEKLAFDKGFLEAAQNSLGGQTIAVLVDGEGRLNEIQRRINLLGLKHIKAFSSVTAAVQFAHGENAAHVRAWLSKEDSMEMSEVRAMELKKAIPDVQTLTDKQIEKFYRDLGLTDLIQRIFSAALTARAA